jgi:hypothetical protein
MRERQESAAERLELSWVQMMAGALAAVSSSVALSRLGVAGTVGGAAVGSVLATAGTAVYGHYLHRTSSSIRAVTPVVPLARRRPVAPRPAEQVTGDDTAVLARPAWEGSDGDDRTAGSSEGRGAVRWGAVGLVSLAVFALAFAGISAVEAASGRSLSSWLSGGDKGPTTLSQIVRPATDTESPAEQREQVPAHESPEATPPAESATEPAPTATPSPTPTSSPSSDPEPTVTPPAATPTPVAPTTTPSPTG